MCLLRVFGPLFATFKTNHEVALSCMNIYQMRFRNRGFVSLSNRLFFPNSSSLLGELNYAFRPKLRVLMRGVLSEPLNKTTGKIRPITACFNATTFHSYISKTEAGVIWISGRDWRNESLDLNYKQEELFVNLSLKNHQSNQTEAQAELFLLFWWSLQGAECVKSRSCFSNSYDTDSNLFSVQSFSPLKLERWTFSRFPRTLQKFSYRSSQSLLTALCLRISRGCPKRFYPTFPNDRARVPSSRSPRDGNQTFRQKFMLF